MSTAPTQTVKSPPGAAESPPSMSGMARMLITPAVAAGLLGGAVLIGIMTLVMGAAGMGYASPVNLGMPAFVYTVAPPASMLPGLMSAMGVSLPAPMMAQIGPMLESGHYLSATQAKAMMPMLTAMHLPAQKIQMMAAVMTGHADNTTVANLMAGLPASARHQVMAAMPVSASHVIVGLILHFAFSAFLGIAFFAVIAAAARMGMPAMRTRAGMMAAGVVGGAIVYVLNRWVFLPPANPMMRLVPQIGFFAAHLAFGLIVGSLAALAIGRAVRQMSPVTL
ncbi:MAG: hypothetical protein KGQ66_19800 [Acidobacteriota bacterium]|nr:hypothetical protein [Acidobacteriota bacterium]